MLLVRWLASAASARSEAPLPRPSLGGDRLRAENTAIEAAGGLQTKRRKNIVLDPAAADALRTRLNKKMSVMLRPTSAVGGVTSLDALAGWRHSVRPSADGSKPGEVSTSVDVSKICIGGQIGAPLSSSCLPKST